MSPKSEDELDTMPEAELLALPGEAIPSGRLTAFFTRRAALLRQHELDELASEHSGNSSRHFIMFPGMDPQERRRREEDEQRRALQAQGKWRNTRSVVTACWRRSRNSSTRS
jgi:hypothetical protein